jgi:ribosomal protein S18 acetylase RimI-like enzyme
VSGAIALRPVEPGDYEYVVSIDPWGGGRKMAALLPRLFFEHFGRTTTIAVDSETRRIVGFVCGFVSQTDPDVAYIHFIGIDPERRGAGAGKALYEWFFSQAVTRGCRRVTCVTAPQNTGSAPSAAMGFSEHWVED